MLARDWQAGEMRVLFLAVCMATACLSSVGYFVERAARAVFQDAHQLLGGDLLVEADLPLPEHYVEAAQQRGLKTAFAVSLMSMAQGPGGTHLVALKAVDAGYPLRGRLRVAQAPGEVERDVREGPAPGTAWLETPLFYALTGDGAPMAIGERVSVGEVTLSVDAVLTHEPDRGIAFMQVAPRLLIHRSDLSASGLLQPGTRARYQLYLAGPRNEIEAYRAWIKPQLTRGQRVQGLEDARPELRDALQRAQGLLGLAAMLATALAAVAIGLATRRYVERHYDVHTVLRCLGATQGRLTVLFGAQFMLLGLIAGVVGAAIGYGLQFAFSAALAEVLGRALPAAGVRPGFVAMAFGMALLFGFAAPRLVNLRRVPALRVLRREAAPPDAATWAVHGVGLFALAALMYWQSAGNVRLAGVVLAGFLLAAAVFFALARFGLFALAWLAKRLPAQALAFRMAVRNLQRQAFANGLQIVALTLGIAALLILAITRSELIAAWHARLPADAPNRFVLNIQPEQRTAVLEFFRDHGLPEPALYPMLRGRLLAINEQPVDPAAYADDRARRLVEREFNLSYAQDLPAHNRIAAGRWFDTAALAQGAFSVESGLARTLGIRIGDVLTWSVAGQLLRAPVTNLRALEWDSMQVNFFVIGTPALFADHIPAYITSFHLPSGQEALASALVRAFPNLTLIDTGQILDQLLAAVEDMTWVVQAVFLFALAAGILVLHVALISGLDQRRREAALMRALGASRARVLAVQRGEFLLIGLIAGLLSALAATGLGAALALWVYELPAWRPGLAVWIAGPALGLVAVIASTWQARRAVLVAPPMGVLREN